MDLFDYMRSTNMEKESPLAARLRPTTLEEVVGQQHIIGRDKLLYRAIKADKLSSLIFYGPPGTGKTTLAKVIANTTSAEFTQINATVAGKKDMEEVVKKAKDILGMYGKKTILFIDEIHRFNKGQQDYLLPFVEDGTLILIGATTENPYFEVNNALISRSIIFELHPLSAEDIRELLRRAVYDKEKGMGVIRVHAILPVQKDFFLLSKLAVFLLSDLAFAMLLTLLNVGLADGVAVLPAVLLQTAILSLMMALVGLLCALLLKDFRQFTLAYLVIAIFAATPVFLSANTSIKFDWIGYHPFYHVYMGLKNAYFGTDISLAYYVGAVGIIVLLFLVVRLAFHREIGKEG